MKVQTILHPAEADLTWTNEAIAGAASCSAAAGPVVSAAVDGPSADGTGLVQIHLRGN